MNLLFFQHIKSVAQYESKMLMRSWFFRIFSSLIILVTASYNYTILLGEGWQPWFFKAIPSNIPYLNILLYNTAQAIIAVFLSSEFLKRDKQLDTSEVFYVRPLSNTEYVFGKIWGNIRVFLLLNLIVIAIALTMNILSMEVEVDFFAYIFYFFTISIPTLIFIIGLSIFVMLMINNQALTFVLLLAYIGLTLFYIQDKFYYLFDYMVYNLPLYKSTIIGIDNLPVIINHRVIYLFIGLGCIFFTIRLFHRLPNNKKGQNPWLIMAFIMFILAGFAGFNHIKTFSSQEIQRKVYTEINNKFVHAPKMLIEQYDISLEQHPNDFSSVVKMKGTALKSADHFTFCLNPGLQIKQIQEDGKELEFQREGQIITVNMGRTVSSGDSLTLSMNYTGTINEDFCYLDIEPKVLHQTHEKSMLKINKRYFIQTKNYLLLTPETYWYPRPGTSYSNISPDWQQTYFSHFKTTIKTLPGLTGITQSENVPYQAISLIIGNYKNIKTKKDSIEYNLWYIDGHDYFTEYLDSIKDTIPGMIGNMKEQLERNYQLYYPFKNFSLVEIPTQFYSYPHAWSKAQEVMQPGMVLFPEKGCLYNQCNFKQEIKNHKKWERYRKRELSDRDAQIRALNNFLWLFLRQAGEMQFEKERGKFNVNTTSNPYFLFPQIYNYQYNIYSPKWSFTNRMIELYLQKKSDNNNWQRIMNGISNFEKANLVMEKESLKDIVAKEENKEILDDIISLKGYDLFAFAEANYGVDNFRDALHEILEKNTFKNIQFEILLDSLEKRSGTEIKNRIKGWETKTPLPYYTIEKPKITKVASKGEEYYLLEQIISNRSNYDGIVHLDINSKSNAILDPRIHQKVPLKAHETKRLISIWDDYVRSILVNTLISKNLPNIIWQTPINTGKIRSSIYTTDSCYNLTNYTPGLEGEVVVDNEDSLLFSLSDPNTVGLLPKWLDKLEHKSSEFKYSGVNSWRPPFQWTLTSGNDYFGEYIRSAYIIKKGKGDQYAKWKIPIPEEGLYDLYFYVVKSQELRQGRDNADGEYNLIIEYDGEIEKTYFNVIRAEEGWKEIGSFYFNKDTVSVTLTNETKLRSVTADAVKIVKRINTETYHAKKDSIQ